MSHKTSQRTRNGQMNALKYRIHEIAPLLTKQPGETFTVKDFDADGEELSKILSFCAIKGALEINGKVTIERPHCTSHDYVNQYEWDDQIYAKLKSYWEDLDRLPCDHAIHIYNDPEVPEDKLGCKHCAEDGDHPTFDKETVKELL